MDHFSVALLLCLFVLHMVLAVVVAVMMWIALNVVLKMDARQRRDSSVLDNVAFHAKHGEWPE